MTARLGVTPQDESFTEHEVWDFAATSPDQYPLLLHFPYFDLYRKQVVKQADLVLAMHLRGDAFSAEQKARNFAYYEALTVRDSSLSAATQAVMAAEVGQLQLAYDYLGEAALVDLDDLEHNVQDGVHMASLAGAWTALVAGFGGLRLQQASLFFAPQLPIRHRPARLPHHVPQPPTTRRGEGDGSNLPAARGRPPHDSPPWRSRPPDRGSARHPTHPRHRGGTPPHSAAGARANPTRRAHGDQCGAARRGGFYRTRIQLMIFPSRLGASSLSCLPVSATHVYYSGGPRIERAPADIVVVIRADAPRRSLIPGTGAPGRASRRRDQAAAPVHRRS